MIILETTRLTLKTIEKEDSQILHDLIFSNEETMKYTFSHKAFTLEESKKFIYKNFCKNNAIVGLAPLFEKKSGLLVGLAGVLKSNDLGEDKDEFIVIITDEFKESDFEREVIQAELTFIKKRLRKNKAYALIHKDDTVSKILLENASMIFEKSILLQDRGEKEVYTKKV
jgi:RimJ/RimL family protein N-acetyltransferase